MNELERARRLQEIEHLLNDPDVPMQAARIWSLMEEVSQPAPRAGVA